MGDKIFLAIVRFPLPNARRVLLFLRSVRNASVAQSVEQKTLNLLVLGSIPSRGTC